MSHGVVGQSPTFQDVLNANLKCWSTVCKQNTAECAKKTLSAS